MVSRPWKNFFVQLYRLVCSNVACSQAGQHGFAIYAAAELGESLMNNLIWLVGAVVIVLFILGFLGLR
jgi:hypothetical protein